MVQTFELESRQLSETTLLLRLLHWERFYPSFGPMNSLGFEYLSSISVSEPDVFPSLEHLVRTGLERMMHADHALGPKYSCLLIKHLIGHKSFVAARDLAVELAKSEPTLRDPHFGALGGIAQYCRWAQRALGVVVVGGGELDRKWLVEGDAMLCEAPAVARVESFEGEDGVEEVDGWEVLVGGIEGGEGLLVLPVNGEGKGMRRRRGDEREFKADVAMGDCMVREPVYVRGDVGEVTSAARTVHDLESSLQKGASCTMVVPYLAEALWHAGHGARATRALMAVVHVLREEEAGELVQVFWCWQTVAMATRTLLWKPASSGVISAAEEAIVLLGDGDMEEEEDDEEDDDRDEEQEKEEQEQDTAPPKHTTETQHSSFQETVLATFPSNKRSYELISSAVAFDRLKGRRRVVSVPNESEVRARQHQWKTAQQSVADLSPAIIRELALCRILELVPNNTLATSLLATTRPYIHRRRCATCLYRAAATMPHPLLGPWCGLQAAVWTSLAEDLADEAVELLSDEALGQEEAVDRIRRRWKDSEESWARNTTYNAWKSLRTAKGNSPDQISSLMAEI